MNDRCHSDIRREQGIYATGNRQHKRHPEPTAAEKFAREAQLHVTRRHLNLSRLRKRACDNAASVSRLRHGNRRRVQRRFLRARGNAKELERELKVSYPTVRARIDALVRALGLADGPSIGDGGEDGAGQTESAELRRDVLERLARHEMTADEAAALLRARKE